MNYFEYFKLFGVEGKQIPCIPGSGAPTTATEGAVGCLYMDTDTGDMYKCIAVDDGEYRWEYHGGKKEAVTYTPQDLGTEQKAQARTNIGAARYEKETATYEYVYGDDAYRESTYIKVEQPKKTIDTSLSSATYGEIIEASQTAYKVMYFAAPQNLKLYVASNTTYFKLGIYNDVNFSKDTLVKGVFYSQSSTNPLPTAQNPVEVAAGQVVAISTNGTSFKVIANGTTHNCDFVLHNEPQGLTPEQQARARENIGAMSAEENLVKYIYSDCKSAETTTVLRSLESGTYLLAGTFIVAEGVSTMTWTKPTLVCITKEEALSYILFFDPQGLIRHGVITDTARPTLKTYTLADLETSVNRVTTINSESDDEHYPTAKAVYNAIGDIETALDSIIAVQNELLGGDSE